MEQLEIEKSKGTGHTNQNATEIPGRTDLSWTDRKHQILLGGWMRRLRFLCSQLNRRSDTFPQHVVDRREDSSVQMETIW